MPEPLVIRKQGTITWANGRMRRWAIAADRNGDDQLWLWKPEWDAWEKGGPQVMCLGHDEYETPEALLAAVGSGVGYMPGKAPIIHEFEGEAPPLPSVDGAALPFWFSPPDNPQRPGSPSSVHVENGRQVAHIRQE